MKYRKLRIAFSATCGIICLLLIALWVRSYSRLDHCRGDITSALSLANSSALGRFGITAFIIAGQDESWRWGSEPMDAKMRELAQLSIDQELGFGFGLYSDPPLGQYSIMVPHWFLIVLSTVLAAAPWLRWRFSLRTLLIAMTLVAAGLGLIVAFAR